MGGKSKLLGDLFESMFKQISESQGCVVTKIPDGCRQVGKKLIRVKTPFDWIVSYGSKTALIDTKTVQGESFTPSMIVNHQVDELSRHEALGTLAGYVVWFRKKEIVEYISSKALLVALHSGMSIRDNSPDCIRLGSLSYGSKNFDIRQIFKR
jgi:hypothetical protein